MIDSTNDGPVRILTLAHGKANALDLELLTELGEQLAIAEADDCSALVLTGTGHIFSAGVDLFRIDDGGESYVNRFLPALSDVVCHLFALPKPVVVAVNGHAVAGGCILVCTGDVRVGVEDGGRIGIPELRVGVPFPVAALEVMRFAVGDRHLPALALGGATYEPEAARDVGLLDRLVASDELLPTAIETARDLAALGAAFAVAKRQLRQPTIARITAERERTDAEILSLWNAPATRATIRRYLDRTLARK